MTYPSIDVLGVLLGVYSYNTILLSFTFSNLQSSSIPYLAFHLNIYHLILILIHLAHLDLIDNDKRLMIRMEAV